MCEQIAFAPASPPPTSPVAGDVPPWLGQLERMAAPAMPSPPARSLSPDTPTAVVNPPSNAGRPFAPGGIRLPQRELRIKVWEDEEADTSGPDAAAGQRNGHGAPPGSEPREVQAQVPQEEVGEVREVGEATGVEDLPTVLMPSTFAGEKDVQPSPVATWGDQPPADDAPAGEAERGGADLPTEPLVAQLSPPDVVPARRSPERPFAPRPLSGQMRDAQQQGFPAPVAPNANQPAAMQQHGMPVRSPSSPGFQQPMAKPVPAGGGSAAAPAPARPARRISRMRVVVVLAMLLVLLGAGLIYWIVAYQPFSVPALTNTSLSFSNASLGIALRYPQGWTTQLDAAHQTVSFFDANRVDHVTITRAASNGASIATYVNKEIAQLGLTAQKSLSPATFAGASWQQVQGNILVSGATYTETLLVAQHGNHFYTMVFSAIVQPNATPGPVVVVTYADADHLFFSMFRASFQFL